MAVSRVIYKGGESGIVRATDRLDDPTGEQCLIEVTHSGLCGTDRFYRPKDMVLGHEGVGIVRAVGNEVKELKSGDRVGFGFLHSSCGRCQSCLTGHEQYCLDREVYGSNNPDQGSLASHVLWRESYLFRIPESISSEHAAPLMCAGMTVYNALQDTKPHHRVGVLGIGGLGHLAVQFAAKMGCHVVAFSSSDDKKEEALEFGAKEFYALDQLKGAGIASRVDRLLLTASTPADWDAVFSLVGPRGTIYPLTVDFGHIPVQGVSLNRDGVAVQGSFIAPRSVVLQMLDFAALHGIKPVVQTWAMDVDGIEHAFSALDEKKMRYRGVLTTQT